MTKIYYRSLRSVGFNIRRSRKCYKMNKSICDCGGWLYKEYGYSIQANNKLGSFDRCDKCYKIYNFVEDIEMIDFGFPQKCSVKVLKLRPTAKLPTKAEGDMCYDLYADIEKPVWIGQGYVIKIPTGLKVAPAEGYHLHIRPRSGLAANHGIDVLAGCIDGTYRGELIVVLTKASIAMYEIKPGDKIAQFKIERDETHEIVEVKSEDELGITCRGEKSFGSSGR